MTNTTAHRFLSPVAPSFTDPPAHPPAAMSPGTYLRKRRKAAALSIDDVALQLGHVEGDAAASRAAAADIRNALAMLEADNAGDYGALVGRLHGAFRFDHETLIALVVLAADPDADVPVREICRVCACTWFDPCAHRTQGLCSWAERRDGEDPICTHCELALVSSDADA